MSQEARTPTRLIPDRVGLSLREASQAVVDAFSARPDVDERDHPEGLSSAQVEEEWAHWDLRQMKALDALRAALAAPVPEEEARHEP